MKTNCRPLTVEEQAILKYVMYKKQLNQCIIAEKNNYTHSAEINQICTGAKKVSPHFKEIFKNCDIDLDEIMNFKRFKKPTIIKTRALTKEECAKLNQIIREKHLNKEKIAAKAYTSKNLIYKVCNGTYKVSGLMKEHFLKSDINLDEIMV